MRRDADCPPFLKVLQAARKDAVGISSWKKHLEPRVSGMTRIEKKISFERAFTRKASAREASRFARVIIIRVVPKSVAPAHEPGWGESPLEP